MRRWGFALCAATLGAASTAVSGAPPVATGTPSARIAADSRPHAVDVKLRAADAAARPETLLPADLRRDVVRVDPLVTLSRERARAIGADAMLRWFRLALRPDVDPRAFARALEGLGVFDAVEPAAQPAQDP
jgi:hypothetical protein